MARVYGRFYVKETDEAFSGEILFEPRVLGYICDDVLFASTAMVAELDENGRFSVELDPIEYFVRVNDACLEIDVPAVEKITLKELLQTRYEKNK